jgi:hypothetical protein
MVVTFGVRPLTLTLSPGYRGEGREVWTAHTTVGAGLYEELRSPVVCACRFDHRQN